MKENHVLALIVAYYLSKFDKEAYRGLEFNTQKEAHNEVGRILGVKPNSVKNMRDEFDPVHDNPRVGWYQGPLRPSRVKVLESFQDLKEEELRDVVLEILTNPNFQTTDEYADIVQPISKRDNRKKSKSIYLSRTTTGRKAEEYFLRYFEKNQKPFSGEILDRRDHGCGFDFEIQSEDNYAQIEVKGLDSDSGGILLTSKEWDIAQKNKNSYYLVIVRNVSYQPEIQLIQNPAGKLHPQKNVYTSVQVRWTVSDSNLSSI